MLSIFLIFFLIFRFGIENRSSKDNTGNTGDAEITKDKVQLLVETVERSGEIDSNRAEESLNRAKMRKEDNKGELDQSRMDISMTRAMNRLKVSQR